MNRSEAIVVRIGHSHLYPGIALTGLPGLDHSLQSVVLLEFLDGSTTTAVIGTNATGQASLLAEAYVTSAGRAIGPREWAVNWPPPGQDGSTPKITKRLA